jgi:hypothetical protein
VHCNTWVLIKILVANSRPEIATNNYCNSFAQGVAETRSQALGGSKSTEGSGLKVRVRQWILRTPGCCVARRPGWHCWPAGSRFALSSQAHRETPARGRGGPWACGVEAIGRGALAWDGSATRRTGSRRLGRCLHRSCVGVTLLPGACPSQDRPPALARTRSRPLLVCPHRQPALRLYGGAADTPKPMASAGTGMGDPQSAGFQRVNVFSLPRSRRHALSVCIHAWWREDAQCVAQCSRQRMEAATCCVLLRSRVVALHLN